MTGHVVVTGATGFLGGRLARALRDEGRPVLGLGRSPRRGARLQADGVPFAPVELSDRAGLDAACRKADTVVHCAALSTAWATERAYHAANVVGTENVLEAARRAGVRRLVHVSTPAVLSAFRDQVDLSEDEPLPDRFTSTYGASKARAEGLVAAADGIETVIVRPKAIYGPDDTALLPRVVDLAARGRLRILGDGRTLTHLTHVDDVVQALRLVIDHPAPSRLYHVAGPEPARLWDAIADLLARLGYPPPARRLATGRAMRVAAAMEALWRATGARAEPPLTRYKVAVVAYTQTLDTARARRELGFAPRVSLGEGLDGVVRALSDPASHAPSRTSSPRAAPAPILSVDFAVCGRVRPPARAMGGGRGRTEIPILVAVLRRPDGGVTLVDTGFGTARATDDSWWWRLYGRVVRPELRSLRASLGERGVDISDVTSVLLTHFDPDHAGGLGELPDAEVWCSAPAWGDLARTRERRSWWRRTAPDTLPADLAARIRLFDPGPTGHEIDVFGDGSVHAVSLPGHMHGHVGVRVTDLDGRRWLLCADAVWRSAELRAPAPGLSRWVAVDRDAARASHGWIRARMAEDPELLVVPSHCPEAADRLLGPAWRGGPRAEARRG